MVETVKEAPKFPALKPNIDKLLQQVQDEYLGDEAWNSQPLALEMYDGAYQAKFMPQKDPRVFRTVMKWTHPDVTLQKFTDHYYSCYQEKASAMDKTTSYENLVD